MRKEIWVHGPTGTTFTDRQYYLDFMRRRYRERLAIRRLQEHHARCWAVLDQIHDAMAFEDIEIFLNDHHHEIESVCSARESRYKLDNYIRIKRLPERDTDHQWCAQISYSYSRINHKMRETFWREDRKHFSPLMDDLSKVLARLGFEMGGGSGMNGRMTYPRAMISKAQYYSADVMEILAA